ncbi:MAG TPA: bifunctional DNA-formamidopyrimidine glycosylase/DNA-(apurinic or apyrimidinic site) lyase [Actinomycetota bacterium]|nr:bifunctional DNA-formamidopyrimidine glycosylase/DNA-(apurinic or apyrimidinic site) lyase [Actinomycetota bacterium]
MPELPEIEVLRRDLEKEIVNRRVKEVEVRPGSNAMKAIARHGRRKDFADLLVGAKVDRIDRKGALLLLELDNQRTLVFDLGPAGQLLKTSASDEIETHTHVVIAFTIGGHLRFVDPAKEGEVYVLPAEEVPAATHTDALDPLEQPVAWHHFSALLEERKAPLKELLQDSEFIVAIGDVYSDEILFAAGLRHDRPSNKLTSQDVRRLYRALMEILQDAVKARGTSLDDPRFTDLQGVPGGFQLELKVFDREGEFCRRCRNAIVKEPFGDSFTYFCPQCQS